MDKLSEVAKSTILGNVKTPHNTPTQVKFYDVNPGELIKTSSHQFDFDDNPNGQPNNDLITEDHNTDNDGDTTMIITNLSKR